MNIMLKGASAEWFRMIKSLPLPLTFGPCPGAKWSSMSRIPSHLSRPQKLLLVSCWHEINAQLGSGECVVDRFLPVFPLPVWGLQCGKDGSLLEEALDTYHTALFAEPSMLTTNFNGAWFAIMSVKMIPPVNHSATMVVSVSSMACYGTLAAVTATGMPVAGLLSPPLTHNDTMALKLYGVCMRHNKIGLKMGPAPTSTIDNDLNVSKPKDHAFMRNIYGASVVVIVFNCKRSKTKVPEPSKSHIVATLLLGYDYYKKFGEAAVVDKRCGQRVLLVYQGNYNADAIANNALLNKEEPFVYIVGDERIGYDVANEVTTVISQRTAILHSHNDRNK